MHRIKIQELSKDLDNILIEYGKKIDQYVEEGTDKNITDAKNELRVKSPKAKRVVSIGVGKKQNPGAYSNSWYIVSKKNKYLYTKVVANRIYQLTHLLEFGHASRNGSPVKAVPHIRPTEDKFQLKFIEGLEENIRRG